MSEFLGFEAVPIIDKTAFMTRANQLMDAVLPASQVAELGNDVINVLNAVESKTAIIHPPLGRRKTEEYRNLATKAISMAQTVNEADKTQSSDRAKKTGTSGKK